MKQAIFYEAFAYNPSTCQYDIWRGTATLETIRRYGLKPDLGYPLYADEKLAHDGWGIRAP
jgi:hypothetical protein